MTAGVGPKPVPQDGVAVGKIRAGRTAAPHKAETDGFDFGDFIDIINPLQHIPGIAELYRSVTNDRISDDARKAGNALYGFALGGPVGLGAMLAYNALGDRLGAASGDDLPETGEAQEVVRAPEPKRLSDVLLAELKPGNEISETLKRPGEEPVLGEAVAAAGAASNPPMVLSGLATGAAGWHEGRQVAAAEASGRASSIAYVDAQEFPLQQKTVVPQEQDLNRIAAHEANRLPLDVLKALQERHAERTASERS